MSGESPLTGSAGHPRVVVPPFNYCFRDGQAMDDEVLRRLDRQTMRTISERRHGMLESIRYVPAPAAVRHAQVSVEVFNRAAFRVEEQNAQRPAEVWARTGFPIEIPHQDHRNQHPHLTIAQIEQNSGLPAPSQIAAPRHRAYPAVNNPRQEQRIQLAPIIVGSGQNPQTHFQSLGQNLANGVANAPLPPPPPAVNNPGHEQSVLIAPTMAATGQDPQSPSIRQDLANPPTPPAPVLVHASPVINSPRQEQRIQPAPIIAIAEQNTRTPLPSIRPQLSNGVANTPDSICGASTGISNTRQELLTPQASAMAAEESQNTIISNPFSATGAATVGTPDSQTSSVSGDEIEGESRRVYERETDASATQENSASTRLDLQVLAVQIASDDDMKLHKTLFEVLNSENKISEMNLVREDGLYHCPITGSTRKPLLIDGVKNIKDVKKRLRMVWINKFGDDEKFEGWYQEFLERYQEICDAEH